MDKKSLKIKFGNFVNKYYLPFAKNNKRSWNVDDRIIKLHIMSTFCEMLIGEINSRQVSLWLNNLVSQGLNPATCNRILAVLRSIFSFACREDYLEKSPCRNISSFKVSNIRRRHLSEVEAKLLMDELMKYNCAYAAVLKLLLLTGARKSEILQARWENIDYGNKTLFVPISKSGKSRHIMLSDEAISIIKNLRRHQDSPWLFPSRNPEKPITDIYNFWNKIRLQLGLEDVRVHDLRHSFASFLVNGGYTLFDVQKLLGHSDPRTTMCYAHLGNKVMQEAATFVSGIYLIHESKRLGKNMGCPFLSNIFKNIKSMEIFKNIIREMISEEAKI